jgi:hypothetical protein
VATKEFLNELVRRFPERPPPFPGSVMSRILEPIHRWKEGICSESHSKEDLGNIKDMRRLFTFQGYCFREIPSRVDAPSTMVSSSVAHVCLMRSYDSIEHKFKSADELESEAQSAILQGLIRRGIPRDLVLAQELMKSLAGANPEDPTTPLKP